WPNLRITTKYSREKPGFWPFARQPSKEPGFWPNLRITTKNYRKNPVSGHPRVSPKFA
ncbi:hypothetical protein AVDCRST_MAG84-812, partial [uncultured Microcoleus sp.]